MIEHLRKVFHIQPQQHLEIYNQVQNGLLWFCCFAHLNPNSIGVQYSFIVLGGEGGQFDLYFFAYLVHKKNC